MLQLPQRVFFFLFFLLLERSLHTIAMYNNNPEHPLIRRREKEYGGEADTDAASPNDDDASSPRRLKKHLPPLLPRRWNVGGGLGDGQISALHKFPVKKKVPPPPPPQVQAVHVNSVLETDTFTRIIVMSFPWKLSSYSWFLLQITCFFFLLLMISLLLFRRIVYRKHISSSLVSFIDTWKSLFIPSWQDQQQQKQQVPFHTSSSKTSVVSSSFLSRLKPSSSRTRRPLHIHNSNNKSCNKFILPTRVRQTDSIGLVSKKMDDNAMSLLTHRHFNNNNNNDEVEEDTLGLVDMHQYHHHHHPLDTLHRDHNTPSSSSQARLRKHRRDVSTTSTSNTAAATTTTTTSRYTTNHHIMTVAEEKEVEEYTNRTRSLSPQQHSRHQNFVVYPSSPLHPITSSLPHQPPPPQVPPRMMRIMGSQVPSPTKVDTPSSSILESSSSLYHLKTYTTTNTATATHGMDHHDKYTLSSPPTLPSLYTPPPSPTTRRIKESSTIMANISPQPILSTVMDVKQLKQEEVEEGCFEPSSPSNNNNNTWNIYTSPTMSLQQHLSISKNDRIDPSMIRLQLPYCFDSSTSPTRHQEMDHDDERPFVAPYSPLPNHVDLPASSSSSSSSSNIGVIHKRKNLIRDGSSDAATSLSTIISFQDIQFHSLIGGGGFGQVWSATWKGTPVAVKRISPSWIFLNDSHHPSSPENNKIQNEVLQRSITTSWNEKKIQEFCAEVNLLSGMRHPNICLYMGACLEYPNLAIVTELASNGSLWDALRLPVKYESTSFLPIMNVSSSSSSSSSWPVALYGSKTHWVDHIPKSTWYV